MKSSTTIYLVLLFVTVHLTNVSNAQLGIQNIKICVFTDSHYFDTSLLINDGQAFEDYLNFDRKLLRESYAITESLMDSLISEQPDLVLVSGDLTKDGELIAHQKMAAYFGELEAAGAQVFVCPGNHDINNPHAVAFDYDTTYPVPSVTPEIFKSVYENFGFNEAIAVDTASLTYIVEPMPGLQILSMDICRYDSNYIENYPKTSGGFKPQVLKWVKDRIIDARSMGKVIIALQHHNMLEHFTNQKDIFGEYVVDDWENVYTELADLGLKVVFTGHFHSQDIRSITSPLGNTLFDVETGSSVTWPCPYRIATLNTDTVLTLSGKKVENINFDTGSLTFQEHALQELEIGLPPTIIYLLTSPPYNIDQGTAEYAEPAFTETLIAHYAGNEGNPSFSTNLIILTLYLTGYGYIAEALDSVWDDFAPDDWNTNIDLKPSTEKIILDLTILLEGPCNGATMTTELNPDYIPLEQPYVYQPWVYSGLKDIPAIPNPDIVDWVLVEIRDATEAVNANAATKTGRQIAFLTNNGSVVGLDGISNIQFDNSITQQLFVIVRHRNHLPVMSAFPLTNTGGTYSYDFTIGADQVFGGTLAHKELDPDIWGMVSGDGNGDGIINMDDKLEAWSIMSGFQGYNAGDYNLNTQIDNNDKNDFWLPNIIFQSQIPE